MRQAAKHEVFGYCEPVILMVCRPTGDTCRAHVSHFRRLCVESQRCFQDGAERQQLLEICRPLDSNQSACASRLDSCLEHCSFLTQSMSIVHHGRMKVGRKDRYQAAGNPAFPIEAIHCC